jgi:hypothetical protein
MARDKGRRSALNDLFADDLLWHAGGRSQLSGDYRGRDAVYGFFGMLMEVTDGSFHLDLHTVFADEEHGVALVLLHASTIKGSVRLRGGGGGESCSPPFPGIFAELGSPPFSHAEDNSIGGDLTMTGLKSCWLGALRNSVRGNVFVASNTMADPDAMEILANLVRGSIACFSNSPAVQYGDSASSPNQVKRHAFGECAFSVLQPNPSPGGPLEPISVKI